MKFLTYRHGILWAKIPRGLRSRKRFLGALDMATLVQIHWRKSHWSSESLAILEHAQVKDAFIGLIDDSKCLFFVQAIWAILNALPEGNWQNSSFFVALGRLLRFLQKSSNVDANFLESLWSWFWGYFFFWKVF